MLSLNTTTASAAALDRADTSARAAVRAGAASDGEAAQGEGAALRNGPDAHQRAAESAAAAAIAGVTHGLSTVAAVGVTVGSLPAALCRMSDIALASNSGTLSDTERASLHTEYAALSQQVTSAVGETGRAAKVQATNEDQASSREGTREEHPGGSGSSGRHDAHASPLARGTASKPATEAVASHAPVAHRIDAAPAAALAQFRQQQSAAQRARLSVQA